MRVRRQVAEACRTRGLRLTPARALVLEALAGSHRALTAYELLAHLSAAELGSQPPVAYRALAFLERHGFVHRIERLSAYAACTHGPVPHDAAFMICRLCRTVAETARVRPRGLAAEAASANFEVERLVVEAEGVCAGCRSWGA